ncbi:caffeic acid 3-O-methyltransferase-like [Durio zibethinus]|uniref:Caffeic acid 3-O-methyltransferase-like n=1 Tax=Durio zibethinus TaxID=66656 RepID=A0A6P5YX45_DURZI|nr:caffeic acid 3-O-methyltransferase-like [Durio zibethinus]
MSTPQNQLSLTSMSEEEEAFGYAWCLRSSDMLCFVLDAAIQLGVFEIIAKAGPGAHLSSSEIASQLRANNPEAPSLLDRVLRLLACYDLVTCVTRNLDGNEDGNNKIERVYGLALPGKAFVPDENKGSLAGFTFSKTKIEACLSLKDKILDGGNVFERLYGVQMPVYQYMSLNSEMARKFDSTMTNISKIVMKKVLDKYQGFQGITTLVDVGGGYGITLSMIISMYPSIRGINYDLPHVIQGAPSFCGIEHIGGDMFSSVPKADAIMMKDVLHNWNDERCLKVLRNCYEALADKGKVIVVSYVMHEEPQASNGAKFVCHMDLLMALQDGAKQRTESQFKDLSKAAGFSNFQLSSRIFNAIGVMEFYK